MLLTKIDQKVNQSQQNMILRTHHMHNWTTIFKIQFNRVMTILTIFSATRLQITESKSLDSLRNCNHRNFY